ncbi:penicillin acylase family protein [Tenacibaculum litopenaei]|uniref:penicillin acylase family protein n=1 Tax=Tenacibaculum litopenaei TaxID=396016 RepID=UPI0038B58130
MRVLKRLLLFVLGLILLLIIGVWIYSFYASPSYEGQLELKELENPVDVYFDDNGIPHIYAESQYDAYQTLGYVHAQDRLWQMELIRRIAPGRLSELFGEKLLKVDRFFKGLGIEDATEKALQKLDTTSKAYKLTQSYLKGVNEFIENGKTPLEYHMLGVEKEPYTIRDVYHVFGYMAFSFAVAHKTDPLLNEVKEKLGAAYLEELLEATESNVTAIKNAPVQAVKGSMITEVQQVLETLPIPTFIGSNSWVVGPNKTANKKVIFANDPHIGYAQPAVWYQSHIVTPDYEMYGFNLALTPFPLLGHNRNYAYGLTMFENDDVDFFYEEDHPSDSTKYATENGYQKYQIATRKIKVKGAEDVVFEQRISRHGPLMNEVLEGLNTTRPVAMQWIYTKEENQLLDVAYELSHAKSLEGFKRGAAKLHAPGLNMMYGDASDNIAWFAAGKLYKYRDSIETKVFLEGKTGKDEIVSYLNFDSNPQAVNPPWNYVYSANNQPDSIAGMLYPGYYLPEDRAKRIVHLLESKSDITQEDMETMITDIRSTTAPEISNYLITSTERDHLSPSALKALELLRSWDGKFELEAVGPVIYNRWWYEFVSGTFKDELGPAFKVFVNTPLEEKVMAQQVRRVNSVWWDDIKTPEKETKRAIVTAAFNRTVSFLKTQLGENVEDWKWKRVMSVEHEHAIGKAGGLLRSLFNVGPFVSRGGDQVINNHIYKIDSTGYYKVHAGPSTRRIIDFSDIEGAKAIIPTGQSGNLFSPYYGNQAEKYVNGKFVPMLINEAKIKEVSKKLRCNPGR